MNVKGFGESTIIYAIGNVGLRFVGFFLMPLYTHSLSVSETGQLMTLLLTIQVLLILMKFGLLSSIVRFLPELNLKNTGENLPCNSMLINLFTGIIFSFIFIIFFPSFFKSVLKVQDVHHYIFLVCGAAFFQSVCMHGVSYYRAKNEASKFTLASIFVSLLLFLLSSLFLLVFKLGVYGVLIAQIISYGLGSVFILIKIFSISQFNLSIKLLKKLINYGFSLVIIGFAWFLLNNSTRYFLGYFDGLESVAIYSVGNLLASVLAVGFAVPFKLAYEPYVFSNLDKFSIRISMARLFTYALLILVLTAFLMICVSRILLKIIAPEEYVSAYLMMLWLLPKFVFAGVYHVGTTLLLINKRTYLIATVVTGSSLINLILNYLFVSNFGWQGGALSTNISLGICAIGLLILGVKNYWIPIEFGRIVLISVFFIFAIINGHLLFLSADSIFYAVNFSILTSCIMILRYSSFFTRQEKVGISEFKNTVLQRTRSRAKLNK